MLPNFDEVIFIAYLQQLRLALPHTMRRTLKDHPIGVQLMKRTLGRFCPNCCASVSDAQEMAGQQ